MSNESVTIWFRRPDGTITEKSGFPAPVVPDGCEPIDGAEYRGLVQAHRDAQDAAAAEERAQVAAQDARFREAMAKFLAAADAS